MSTPVRPVAARRPARRVAAILAVAVTVLGACGNDGPVSQSDVIPDIPTSAPPVSAITSSVPTSAPAVTTSTVPTGSVVPSTSTAVSFDDGGRVRAAPTAGATVTTTSPESWSTNASTTTAPTTSPVPTTTTTSAPPTTTSERTAPRRVLVIGDSSAAGMRWTAGARNALRGAQFTLDLESCRRLVSRSCNGREGYTPSTALDALRWHAAGNHDTLIMATGYNDMDRNFADAFDRIVAEARRQGIETIFWTTYREQVGYQLPSGASSAYAEMNDQLALRVLSGGYPELRILDWWGYTQDAPRWLARDGVHFARAGGFGMADMISRELAALDGRPCPVAWELWTEPADPCPPPMEELERRGEVPPVLYLYGVAR